jgi:prolyl oligopeptidase
MRKNILVYVVCLMAAAAEASGDAPPVAPINPAVDDYFGVKITDPYRYMENLDDPAVQSWVKAQATYTRNVLDSIPGRAGLLADIEKYDNGAPATVSGVHRIAGDRYFYLKTLAGGNLAKLYVRQGTDGPETLIVDTDQFKGPHGEPAAINSYSPSYDGKYVAYVISLAGHEIGSLHVMEVATGKDVGEPIDRVWDPGVNWLPDNESFFFTRLQKLGPHASQLELEENSRAYLHTVGQSADADLPVFGSGVNNGIDLDPIDMAGVMAQPGSDYVVAFVNRGVEKEMSLYAATMESVVHGHGVWTKICAPDAGVTDVDIHGNDLYLLTHKNASRYKIIQTSLAQADLTQARMILPESDAILRGMIVAADALYVHEVDNAITKIVRIPYGAGPQMVKLTFEGSGGIYASDPGLPGAVLDLESWIRGDQIYLYDPTTDQVEHTDLQPAGPYDEPDDLISEEVNAPSYDGALIPLSIIRQKDAPRDGNRPTFIFAYGAYGISMDPGFNPRALAWLRRGGVIAVAHVRGGGEKGEDWHLAGYKLTKPNTWRDTIAAAEYLIDQKYTSPKRLAVWGGSAGGITVGRAITERPDLFAAAVPEVGVMNAVRVENSPNGVPNIPEFGSVKTQEGFEDLYAMDSYLHIRDGVAYPGVLVITGLQDPRVSPWQPMKFAVRLQAATSSGRPVLLRVDYSNGHGIGASKKQRDEKTADVESFFLWQFGEADFQPKAN